MFVRCTTAAALACSLLAAPDTARAGSGIEPITTVRIATGLARPVYVTYAPGDFTRAFIVESRSGSTGRIRVYNTKTEVLNGTPFLSVPGVSTGNEQGLLGLAFHPNYQVNGKFYVNHTSGGQTVIAEYTVSANPEIANPTGNTILTISQPQSNHNGGWIGFGPHNDLLYIGMGDGGGANDSGTGHTAATGNGQDITNNLLGKILRIDVDGDDFPADPNKDYAIPASNPFVGVTGDDEIWTYGVRNPWRCGFDRGLASGVSKGDFYIADVGQNAWEEVDYLRAQSLGGDNLGWRCKEGDHNFNFQAYCSSLSFIDPIHEFSHGGSPFRCSITGGDIYRGCAIPSLSGTYFFADYCSEQIWSFFGPSAANFTDRTAELNPAIGNIDQPSGFGQDMRGEIYICDLGGEVYKIIPVTPTIKPADVNCDGVVNVSDLLQVLAEWGSCDGCASDFAEGLLGNGGEGIVNVTELLAVLAQWD